MAEQRPFKPKRLGSNPSAPTHAAVPERTKGRVCNTRGKRPRRFESVLLLKLFSTQAFRTTGIWRNRKRAGLLPQCSRFDSECPH